MRRSGNFGDALDFKLENLPPSADARSCVVCNQYDAYCFWRFDSRLRFGQFAGRDNDGVRVCFSETTIMDARELARAIFGVERPDTLSQRNSRQRNLSRRNNCLCASKKLERSDPN